MPLTKPQAYLIAHLAAGVRDWLRDTNPNVEAWSVEGIVANLAKVSNRRFPDVALATIRAAMDPAAKTPGVIPTDASHWTEGIAYAPPRIPTADEECPSHPGNWLTGCHGCRADKLAGDTTPRPRERSGVVIEHLRSLRGIKSVATAGHCPCGVPAQLCKDHAGATTSEDA